MVRYIASCAFGFYCKLAPVILLVYIGGNKLIELVLINLLAAKRFDKCKKIILNICDKRGERYLLYKFMGLEGRDETINCYEIAFDDYIKSLDSNQPGCLVEKYIRLSKIAGHFGCFRLSSALRSVAIYDAMLSPNAKGELSEQYASQVAVEIFSLPDAWLAQVARLGDKFPKHSIGSIVKKVRRRVASEDLASFLYKAFSCPEGEISLEVLKKEFGEIPKEKVCVVLGPSKRDYPVSFSPEEYVFVIGYAGLRSVPSYVGDFRPFGSFYANHKIEKMLKDGEIDEIEDLELVILKNDVKPLCFNGIKNKARSCFSFLNYHALWTDLNAGVELILMLAILENKKIKVKNMDFFLRKFYPGGYKSNRPNSMLECVGSGWKLGDVETLKTLGFHHAPSFQFSILSYLYFRGRIECDDMLESILEKGLENYLRELEKNYHHLFEGN